MEESPPGEQLSWLSWSWCVIHAPWRLMFEPGIQDRQQLRHAGNERHLCYPARCTLAHIARLEDWILAYGNECCYAGRRGHGGPLHTVRLLHSVPLARLGGTAAE